MEISWKLGVEIELLAPPGASRRTLAEAIAGPRGAVRPFFHLQSEPSKVPGTPVFANLTPGFAVTAEGGALRACCVGDVTLIDDLDRAAPPQPGWYRVVSDDARLLRLIARHATPDTDIGDCLGPVGALFGTAPTPGPGGMFRLVDQSGAPIAIAAPLPGERERACELVTAPIEAGHHEELTALLRFARDLGFSCPVEGATHLHFDGAPLRSAPAFANLVNLLETFRPVLRAVMQTNPNCRRLGPWPTALLDLVGGPDFRALDWPEAEARLGQTRLQKYCDFNLLNVVARTPDKETFEVRILPTRLDATEIIRDAEVFQAVLRRALAPAPFHRRPVPPPGPAGVRQLADAIGLSVDQADALLARTTTAASGVR